MYDGLCWHSPATAHCAQPASSSTHSANSAASSRPNDDARGAAATRSTRRACKPGICCLPAPAARTTQPQDIELVPVSNWYQQDIEPKCRGAATNGLKAKTLRSRSTPGAAQSYSSSWTRSARRSRLPRRTSHSRSTSTVGRIRCSRPSSGCATQQPRSHPRASSWRPRRRRPTTLHAPTTRPMWQAVGRWGQARQRGGPRQRRTAARERWVSVVRRVARVKRHHSNARRGTRAHVPSAYRRRCG